MILLENTFPYDRDGDRAEPTLLKCLEVPIGQNYWGITYIKFINYLTHISNHLPFKFLLLEPKPEFDPNPFSKFKPDYLKSNYAMKN